VSTFETIMTVLAIVGAPLGGLIGFKLGRKPPGREGLGKR
jgi:hypothetical protein